MNCCECNAPMIATASGSVCANGCGRLGPPLSTATKRRNHAIVALGLKDARLLPGGHYEVDGKQYEKSGKAITRILDSWPSEVPRSETLALEGDKIIRLKPVET